MELLLAYTLRLLPGLLLGALFLFLLPRNLLEVRIASYILLFVLVRDVMTPVGLWTLHPASLTLSTSPLQLTVLGVLCGTIVAALVRFDTDARALFSWFRGRVGVAIVTGVAGALFLGLVVALAHWWIEHPIFSLRVTGFTLVLMLLFALVGNLLEEVLFRGYVQGYMERHVSPLRAAILSGVCFAFCHTLLALAVTHAGWVLLAFTLTEGVVAGLVCMRCGVVAATLTHGGAIFLISSGIV